MGTLDDQVCLDGVGMFDDGLGEVVQDVELALLRSDYMLDAPSGKLLQVGFGTVLLGAG